MAVPIYMSLALLTLVTFLYYYFTRTFNYWKHRGVVGPKPVPFFGNLKESFLRQKNIGVVFKELYEAFPNEKVVGIYRMTTPCLLIRDLEIIKHVMIKDFDVFFDRGVQFSKKGLGANLFHADGETWGLLRKHFTPMLTSGKLKNMFHLMAERADSFVEFIDELCAKQSEQEIHQLLQKYTMTLIAACAFGLDIDMQHDQDTINELNRIDQLMFTVNYYSELDMMYPGVLKLFNLSLFPRIVKTFFFKLVQDLRHKKQGIPSNLKYFMDFILELRKQGEIRETRRNKDGKEWSLKVTDDMIADQAFVFYGAGYETSAMTMSFMLYEMAKNPDIQDKLIADIGAVLERHNGDISYESLQDMTYYDKVFDETLRLHPLIEPLQRNVKIDYKVPGTNLTIKKGTTVVVSPSGIHHDEKYYTNPKKFDPERHNPGNSKDRHACAFVPFGVGPRSCIGIQFAKVESRVCMVKFFSKFRVEMSKNTPSEITVCPNRFIIGPKGGIRVNIVRR